jgi:GIY-YIG catalytic domain
LKYTIYQITNIINNKIYIGKHQTENLDDGYMGSGKLLKYAQEKYGTQSFVKRILYTFDTEEQMNAKEAELVTAEFCVREDTYNICIGGLGGFSYINSVTRTDPSSEMEQKRVSKMRATLINKGIRPPVYIWTEERRQRNSETQKRMLASGTKRSYFKESNPMSDPELRSRHKEAVKNNSKGPKNSQYGTLWITDGLENKKIRSVDSIPEGWYKGRVLKKSLTTSER